MAYLLSIESNDIEAAKSAILSALNAQKRALSASIFRTKNNIQSFEQKYNMSTEELLSKESNSTLDDSNLELIEWLGEVRLLKRLEVELETIKSIKICS